MSPFGCLQNSCKSRIVLDLVAVVVIHDEGCVGVGGVGGGVVGGGWGLVVEVVPAFRSLLWGSHARSRAVIDCCCCCCAKDRLVAEVKGNYYSQTQHGEMP